IYRFKNEKLFILRHYDSLYTTRSAFHQWNCFSIFMAQFSAMEFNRCTDIRFLSMYLYFTFLLVLFSIKKLFPNISLYRLRIILFSLCNDHNGFLLPVTCPLFYGDFSILTFIVVLSVAIYSLTRGARQARF